MWGTSFVCKLDAFNWVDAFCVGRISSHNGFAVLVAEKYAFQSLAKNHVDMLKLFNAQGLQLCGISKY